MSAAISDLSSLAALAWDPSLDVRPALLRVQADLFANAPARDPEAIASFEALALGLLPTVDDAAALAVAHILAPVDDTPGSVVRFLVARGGEIARTVIAGAPRLTRHFRLAELARNPAWADAVAGRPDLGPDDVAALAERGEPALDRALARNPAAPLSGRALARLVDRARADAELAAALLARPDLPASERAALYLAAPGREREAIRSDVERAPVPRATPHPRPSREAVDALVERARAGDVAGFEERLSALLGLEPGTAFDMHRPERHDLLPLALAAAGIGEEDGVTILLTLHDAIARSVPTVFRLAGILRETPRSTAIRLVEAILDRPLQPRREGRHQPLHDPAARPRTGAAPAQTRERPDVAALRTAAGRAR